MFDKYTCLGNIRILLRNSSVKIGQIEKAAGCQLGYMSRMEKPTSTVEPSMEFICTAAKMLNTSIDSLVFADFSKQSPTEQYLIDFFEKLRKRTVENELNWEIESINYLNTLESDYHGEVEHPLFTIRSYEEDGYAGEEHISRILFDSATFGNNTRIRDDCYHLQMPHSGILYLMDIAKYKYSREDIDTTAKEVWLFAPETGLQMLATDHSEVSLASEVTLLYQEVSSFAKRPRLDEGHRMIIDDFMTGICDSECDG